MELTARYGLEFNPFLKNSKEILFEGAEYTEAKFRLDYLARTKGFGLLTGLRVVEKQLWSVPGLPD